MPWILGISAYYHDAAAVLVEDGRIVAAAQEERFSRIKHDPSFPRQAIAYCLQEAGIGLGDVAVVGFYEKPLRKFERLLDTWLSFAPRGFAPFRYALPKWLTRNVNLRRELHRELGPAFRGDIFFAEHHEAHAASAFFPSPFEEAAILTLDGAGEWATGSIGVGRGSRVELLKEMRFPHSLGLLYSAFTYFCGFKVNDGEYKLMGLAPYGTPRYADLIRDKLVTIRPDGSFFLDQRYFDYCAGLHMTSREFDQLFGGPPRTPDQPLTEREMDLAASVQVVTEEIILNCARHTREVTGLSRLCLAGGVSLNCVANGKLLAEGLVDELWIQPAAGDAGGALGVALLMAYHQQGLPRVVTPADSQHGSYLGPGMDEGEIRRFLDDRGVAYRFIADEEALCDLVAAELAAGKVVGWVQGRMEFGPRALGARSILADARDPGMQERVNRCVKERESFRPFAPIVLRERAAEYFDVPADYASPYMLLTAPVHPAQRLVAAAAAGAHGLELLKVRRSTIPAVTHVDDSARIQTVTAARNGRLHRLLAAFDRRTGCPVLLNTSFNGKDEPIVCRVADAWNCFTATGLDLLVLERFVVEKNARERMPG
jgi:carbamoyltransferase